MLLEDIYDLYLQHPVICTDTRKVQQGSIFFALKGEHFDGNSYAQQAIERGAVYAVVDDAASAVDSRYILVADVLDTMQQLAHYHRMQLKIPVIAITGSNGKTTTKELITAVLRKKLITYATIGNLNNHIGVPLTLLSIGRDADIAVIEMGANHQREIAAYCQIAVPTHGIITNCGKAHIEDFGGLAGVRKGKGELYDYLRQTNGTIFRNADLVYLNEMSHDIARQITYGTENATYTGRQGMEGVFLNVGFEVAGATHLVQTRLVGAYNFPNVITAIAIGLHFGIPAPLIKEAIESYIPDNSRSQWIQRGTNTIVLDAYNANPTSMQAAIANFASSTLQNKVLWVGGMKEMGTAEQEEHQALIKLVDSYKWQDVILVGKEFLNTEHNHKWFADSTAAAIYIKKHMPEKCAILIKGSRGAKMEIMADMLLQTETNRPQDLPL